MSSKDWIVGYHAVMGALEDGRVAVVDSLNRRIQIFKVEPLKPGGANG